MSEDKGNDDKAFKTVELATSTSTVTPVLHNPIIVAETLSLEAGEHTHGTRLNKEGTIEPKVKWRTEDRTFTDKPFAVIFFIAYVLWIGFGLYFVINAHDPYEYFFDDETGGEYVVVSEYYRDDVKACCGSSSDGICRYTERVPTGYNSSRNENKQGIFYAFLHNPEIPSTAVIAVGVIAFIWLILLKKFSRPIVYGTEVTKIVACVWVGTYILTGSDNDASGILFYIVGAIILGLDIWRRENFVFAAKIIKASAVAINKRARCTSGQSLLPAVLGTKLVFIVHAVAFVFFITESFQNYSVKKDEDDFSCSFDNNYNNGLFVFECFVYMWIALFLDKVRLLIISYDIGHWYFQRQREKSEDDGPSTWIAIKTSVTKSFGTLSIASLVSAVADRINREMNEPLYKKALCCHNACFCCVYAVFWICFKEWIKALSKFSVIIHSFTGLSFVQSGKKAVDILKRNFANGFITEYCSRSVIWFGAYFFSFCVFLITWMWFDDELGTETGPSHVANAPGVFWFAVIGFLLINMWYPVLALYLIILINALLSKYSSTDEDTQSVEWEDWVTVLASIFVGIVAMLLFTFIGDVILDAVDILFLCHVISKENGLGENELSNGPEAIPAYDEDKVAIASLIKAVPGYLPVAKPIDHNDSSDQFGAVVTTGVQVVM